MAPTVSVLIPACNEQFLARTVEDIYEKAAGDIEVVVVLDGYPCELKPRPNLTVIQKHVKQGMRAAINAAAHTSHGKYLCKTDAHCMFAPGFDKALIDDCDDNWIMIPRRYSLDAENWRWLENGKAPVDYHYLSCPWNNPDGWVFHGQVWKERAKDRADYLIDDEMSFQGSCWFMSRRHYFEFLGGMNEYGYGTFSQEAQEIGLKTWLGGGAVKVNKKTWYAHLHKGRQYGRGYYLNKREIVKSQRYAATYWMRNLYNGPRDIGWLVDKFWPVPTWPDNWRTLAYPKEAEDGLRDCNQ